MLNIYLETFLSLGCTAGYTGSIFFAAGKIPSPRDIHEKYVINEAAR